MTGLFDAFIDGPQRNSKCIKHKTIEGYCIYDRFTPTALALYLVIGLFLTSNSLLTNDTFSRYPVW